MNDKAEKYLIHTNMMGGFNPNQYALLLKQDIADKLKYDLWKFREQESGKFKSTYGMCNNIMQLVEKSVLSF